jgi:predicted RNase H-like HicB family nuclease
MNLKVILEPSDEGGFTAIVPALPGCISEGDTREEALGNIREAIQLYLEEIDPFPYSQASRTLGGRIQEPALVYCPRITVDYENLA